MKKSLREWRESQGWSQSFLANKLSKIMQKPISQVYISRLENGQHPLYNIGVSLQKMAKNDIDFGK
jgi:transcriptional regulator with XRE-family HTH domain